MRYRVQAPGPPLDAFVDSLWSLRDAPAHASERILPSGTLELVINLHDDELRIYDRERPGSCERFGGMVVSGAYRRYFAIDTAEHASVVGVHFRPGGAPALLGVPADEIADAHVDVQALWGPWARELRERLCAADGDGRRFALLEQALRARASRPRPTAGLVGCALEALARPGAAVRAVADRVGLSHRRFIEVFAAEVGMTPKLYGRVRRFQRVLAALRHDGAPDWTRLALESGYFDQPHLIHDFVAFSGLTPADYARRSRARVKENHVAVS